MCFVLIACQAHPDYPIIIAANRDEFFARPATSMHWWDGSPPLLAGRDQRSGGTWFGIRGDGRFTTVTNLRNGQPLNTQAESRGALVTDMLAIQEPLEHAHIELRRNRQRYNPYNLLYGDREQVFHFNSHADQSTILTPGIHALSNASLDTPWPKAVEGSQAFSALLASPDFNIDACFDLLRNDTTYHDVPDTGLDPQRERALSAIFIEANDYGTRTSTVLTVSSSNEINVEERQHAGDYSGSRRSVFRFKASR
ncbi:MAG: hypothetical protein DHS20C01_04020 [marine bacterium B5-7]|nr:MAG: hypothetical protein DHS20C01_04020 [marine bacterium B5-7]